MDDLKISHSVVATIDEIHRDLKRMDKAAQEHQVSSKFINESFEKAISEISTLLKDHSERINRHDDFIKELSITVRISRKLIIALFSILVVISGWVGIAIKSFLKEKVIEISSEEIIRSVSIEVEKQLSEYEIK